MLVIKYQSEKMCLKLNIESNTWNSFIYLAQSFE